MIWFTIDLIYELMPNGELYAKGRYVFMILAIGRIVDISIGSLGQLIVASEWYNYTLLFSLITSALGIVLGYYLTTSYGIIGSALAITITVFVSDIFQILLGYFKLKILPFDNNTIRILVVTIIVFLFALIFDFIKLNDYLTLVLKILFITIVFFGGIYLFNINKETNNLISRALIITKLKKIKL